MQFLILIAKQLGIGIIYLGILYIICKIGKVSNKRILEILKNFSIGYGGGLVLMIFFFIILEVFKK